MCYPKPGPRCSSHAAASLTKLKAQQKRNWAAGDLEASRAMNSKIEEAQATFDATPAGINALARYARQERFGDKHKVRLMTAVFRRKEELAAIQSKDLGDPLHVGSSPKKIDVFDDHNLEPSYEELLAQSSRSEKQIEAPQANALIKESRNWVNKLDEDEIEAAAWFTSNGSSATAAHLTGTSDWDADFDDPNDLTSPAYLEKTVKKLDSALDKAQRRNPVRVFRGLSYETAEKVLGIDKNSSPSTEDYERIIAEKFPIGETFESPTFMSTSRRLSIANQFSSGAHNTVILEFLAKKAGPVTNVSAWSVFEQEYILPRNHSYKVNNVKKVRHGDKNFFIVQLSD